MDETRPDLIDQVEQICQQDRFKQTLLRHLRLPAQQLLTSDINLTIHADDQMLLHSLQHHQNASIALSQYFSISIQQFNAARQIMHGCFGSDLSDIKVLDFACGYGRLLRFLSLIIPASNLHASEIQPQALDFVQQKFAVQGLLSTPDPKDFDTGERFDFIWVASLFSHLPDALFRAWMDKLCSLLSARGVLCFSARSSDLLPAGEVLPDSGILYQRASELTPLEADIYGTAYVSERYVQQCIDKQLGFGHAYSRLPRALANEQDLYLLGKNPDCVLPDAAEFNKSLWGWVDLIRLDQQGALNLEGWAASMSEPGPVVVEVRVEGDVYSVATTIERPDVAASFADPALLQSGWKFRQSLNNPGADPYLEVSACSGEGDLALLYAGGVGSPAKRPGLYVPALILTILLAVLMLVLLFGTRDSDPPEELTQSPAAPVVSIQAIELKLPGLEDSDYDWLAARIFENEASSQVRYLTFWGEGEDFPSFGIGHFIWFPAGVDAPFDEQFPDMVAYVSQRASSEQALPEWLRDLLPFDAPWQNKQQFDLDWSSPEMTALRQWLETTSRWQARFIVRTFEQRWKTLDLPRAEKRKMTKLLQQLAASASGLFAIIDYYNFKGLGVNPRERYQGQDWGLIQVLQAMPAYQTAQVSSEDLLEQFIESASDRLTARVELAPAERNEKRWLPGWLQRLQAYLPIAATEAE